MSERCPRPRSRRSSRTGLSDQLRTILRERGTAYATARAAGLDPGIVARFLSGERGLTLASVDALADALGLRLVAPVGRRGPKSGAGG